MIESKGTTPKKIDKAVGRPDAEATGMDGRGQTVYAVQRAGSSGRRRDGAESLVWDFA